MGTINIERYKEILKLRDEGNSYQKIADKYGITRQAVYEYIVTHKNRKVKRAKEFDGIVYSGIYDMFMADENLSILKLCDIMGYCKCTTNMKKIKRFIYGEDIKIRESAIHNLLKYLNKPYKEVFSLRNPKK